MSKVFEAREKAKAEQAFDDAPGLTGRPKNVSSRPDPVPSQGDRVAAQRVSRPTRLQEVLPEQAGGRLTTFHPDEHLVSLLKPTSFEAEQYRELRAIVEQQHQEKGLSVVAVTSPGSGDGKTTTAINLAGALAQDADARVLVLSADLRQPTLARYLDIGAEAHQGLRQFVSEASLFLLDLVLYDQKFNLAVLPAGGASDSPYEMLKSQRFQEVLDDARRLYDYVVVDTPPLLGCPDCRLIGRFVDAFLVVVAADRTPRKRVEEGLDDVAPDKVLGIVFNGDTEVSRYSSGYYRSSRGRGDRRAGRKGLLR